MQKILQPLVSIAIPTYNRAIYLELAVQSVLNQSYQNFELIISDNASTDCTSDVVNRFKDSRIKFFRQSNNNGMVVNWNYCLSKASGKYFIMLSDDDILDRTAISKLVDYFSNPGIVLVYSRVKFIDHKSRRISDSKIETILETGEQFILGSLTTGRNIVPSATLHLTDLARKVGGYPNIGTSTDFALRLMLAKYGNVSYHPESIVQYRVHPQSLSSALEIIMWSLETLAQWVQDQTNELYEYRDYIRKYCVSYIYRLGLSAAVRNNRPALSYAMHAIHALSSQEKYEYILTSASIPPIRYLAQIRRELKNIVR